MRLAEGGDLVFLVVLFVHIFGAIVTFGPTFAFPFIGAMGGREPQHSNFALRVTDLVSQRLVGPGALLQGITGVILIVLRRWDAFELWLLVSIVLYLISAALAIFVGTPNVAKLIEATKAPPPPVEPGAPVPSGPPPHVAALVARARQVGMLHATLIVIITLLMVFKPTI